MKTNRIEWADIAKGIGILAIIAGHMGITSVNLLVFTFHVPIFFLISGYFLSEKDSFKIFLSKKSKVLLLPYAFTSFLQIISKAIVDFANHTPELILSDMKKRFIEALYGSGSNSVPTPFGIGQIGAIWFLWALFWSLLIVRFFISKKHGFLFIILIASISYFTAKHFWFPLSIQPGSIGAIFTYIGFYAKSRKINFEKINIPIMFLGFISLALEYHFDFCFSMASNNYDGIIINLFCATVISYSIICISILLTQLTIVSKFLKFFGQNSLIVLCFHLIDIDNVPWYLVYEKLQAISINATVGNLLVYISKIVLLALCVQIILKFKLLRKIFNK